MCLFCGKENHLAVDCRILKKTIKALKPKSDRYPQNKSKKYCSLYKLTNHNTNECRKIKTDDSKKQEVQKNLKINPKSQILVREKNWNHTISH